jgi:DNA-binding NarL/FixJ family response regulator
MLMPALKTFLVEDSPVIRESLVAALEEMVPLRVVGQAEDAPSALRWLEDAHNKCDLVIIDIFLRLGSGMDVLRALHERRHSAQRVVLTNYATPDIRSRCAGLGASRVFDKSSEIDELVEYCLELANGRPPPLADGPVHAG